MKKLLASAAAVALLGMASGAAYADLGVTFGGTAAQITTLPTAVTAVDGVTASGTTVAISSFINNTNSTVVTDPVSFKLANVFTNYIPVFGIKSQNKSLTSTNTATATFDANVQYTATATYASSVATLNANGTDTALVFAGNTPALTDAIDGDIVVEVTPIAGLKPILSGSYSDLITVRVSTTL